MYKFAILLVAITIHMCTAHMMCGNRVTNEDMQHLQQQTRDIQGDNLPDVRYILVKNHIARTLDGTTAVSVENAANDLATANKLYATIPYKFVMDTTEIITDEAVSSCQDTDF